MVPELINKYTTYLSVVKNRSVKTITEYKEDLLLFFRYMIATQDDIPYQSEAFHTDDFSRVDLKYVEKITTEQIYAFLQYLAIERKNTARSRAHKLSSLKSFYKYCTLSLHAFENNPVKDIETPTIRMSLPKYLSLEESLKLLQTVADDVESPTRTRDYTIITIFLNCGVRLSELVGLNLQDLDPNLQSMRVLGKGSKERIVYLNGACQNALRAYLEVRGKDTQIKDKNALFLSRLHKRISNKTVQWAVYKYLKEAGFENLHLSTHKLRHTAATLMYQSGQVDVRVLKDILGHEQLNTTQIYTHVSNDSMARAMQNNPLSTVNSNISTKKTNKSGEDTDES
jgi:site-specific recombinase XerD